MGTIIGLAAFAGIIWLLVKTIGVARETGRAIIGKPSVAAEKAMTFMQEKMKDHIMLKSDFNSWAALVYKALEDEGKAMEIVTQHVKSGNVTVYELPDRIAMPRGSSEEAVNQKIDSLMKDLNIKYYVENKSLTEADKSIYHYMVVMTLFALDRLSTFKEAQELVDAKFTDVVNEYIRKMPIPVPMESEENSNTLEKEATEKQAILDEADTDEPHEVTLATELADAIVRSNNIIKMYLADHFDISHVDKDIEGFKTQSAGLAMTFVLQVVDHLGIKDDKKLVPEIIAEVNRQLKCWDARRYDYGVIWGAVKQQYRKHDESGIEKEKIIPMVFATFLGAFTGRGVYTDLYKLLAMVIQHLNGETEEIWDKYLSSDSDSSREVDENRNDQERKAFIDRSQKEITCPFCKKIQKADRNLCYNCGAKFVDAD